MIIAIDGPTASGKGTIAKRIAARYGLKRLDTGALYRAVALALLDAHLDPANEEAAERTARALDPAAIDEHRIRSAAVGYAASTIAAMPAVRAALFDLQRAFAHAPPNETWAGAVLDGRDIATIICPDADVKLFVTASLDQRARRRWLELESRGETADLQALTRQIAERDRRDSTRPSAPLVQAPDAHLLDTTGLSIDEAASAAFRIIDAALDRPKA